MDNDVTQQDEFSPEQPPVDEASPETPPAETTADGKKQNPWKTAFIIMVGIVMLSAVLIYSTSVKRTEPTTVLQTDANGQPVQPLNPASGIEEQRLAALPADAINANANLAAGQLPGGDGYNPWANGGAPPPGGPPLGPGGGYVTVPGGGSQFMPPDCILQPSGIYLCPVPTNANTAVKPTPTPRATPNANVQPTPAPAGAATPKPSPTPAAPRATPTPRTRNTPAPAKSPEEYQR